MFIKKAKQTRPPKPPTYYLGTDSLILIEKNPSAIFTGEIGGSDLTQLQIKAFIPSQPQLVKEKRKIFNLYMIVAVKSTSMFL